MSKPFSLTGRNALVIGASRGVGWGIAEALAAAGAHVVLNSRTQDNLEERAEALRRRGFRTSTAAFDATDIDAATQHIRSLESLDVLVFNAATVMRGSSLDFSVDDWDRMMADNLRTPFVLAQTALERMVAHRFGRIIMTSSIFDRLARPEVAAYVTTKGGISSLTRALAVEFGPHGITVNAIAPGYVRTDATRELHENPEFDTKIRNRTPVGRWAEPEDIGGAAVFLASDQASYVNGTTITVDGGLSASL